MSAVYSAYANYVLKNPFQSLDQPVRLDKFSTAVDSAAARVA